MNTLDPYVGAESDMGLDTSRSIFAIQQSAGETNSV